MLPYQDKFRPDLMRNLYCTFATLSVSLQVVASEGMQYDPMHSQTAKSMLQKYRKKLTRKKKQQQRIKLNRE